MDPELYEEVRLNDQPEGTVLICERLLYDYKRGFPVESKFYRVTVGKRGRRKVAESNPDINWPEIPPWQLGWVDAGSMFRWWRKR